MNDIVGIIEALVAGANFDRERVSELCLVFRQR